MTDIQKLIVVESACYANEFRIINGGNWLCIMRFNGELMPVRQREYASRLVACWNACNGIPTEDLIKKEGDPAPVFSLLIEAMKQRDELLSALKSARTWVGDGENSDGISREFWTQQYAEAVDMVDAAIANVEGNHASTGV